MLYKMEVTFDGGDTWAAYPYHATALEAYEYKARHVLYKAWEAGENPKPGEAYLTYAIHAQFKFRLIPLGGRPTPTFSPRCAFAK